MLSLKMNRAKLVRNDNVFLKKYDSIKTWDIWMKSEKWHWVKSVQIRSLFWYFPVFMLNTEIYSKNLCIQSECRKIWGRENSIFGHFMQCQFWEESLNAIIWTCLLAIEDGDSWLSCWIPAVLPTKFIGQL